jgi:hypothetical protein
VAVPLFDEERVVRPVAEVADENTTPTENKNDENVCVSLVF